MTRGLCLALTVCILTAGCLVLPHVLGFACVAGLGFLYLLTPVGGERESVEGGE